MSQMFPASFTGHKMGSLCLSFGQMHVTFLDFPVVKTGQVQPLLAQLMCKLATRPGLMSSQNTNGGTEMPAQKKKGLCCTEFTSGVLV